jgi:hypothetical protein
VLAITQRYNNGTPVTIANYNYSELGQLTSKGLGIGSGIANITLRGAQNVYPGQVAGYNATTSITLDTNFVAAAGSVFSASIAPAYLQLLDYRYNIRGQLVNINNGSLTDDSGVTQEDPNALFGMELLYNTTDTYLGNTPYYSGRISAVKRMSRNSSNSKSDQRAFKYSYDNTGRYAAANYAKRDSTASATTAFTLTHGWDEGVSQYDENGNIQALHRNTAVQYSSASPTAIDQLKYTYDSNNANQLYSVADTTGNILGFGIQTGGSSGGHYTYDANGNLTVDPYKNIALSYKRTLP